MNPTLVVEVLSDGTEDYDRGEKLEHYKKMGSLQECVLASHRERRLESHRREADGSWSQRSAGAGESLRLESIGCALDVDDLYRGGLGRG